MANNNNQFASILKKIRNDDNTLQLTKMELGRIMLNKNYPVKTRQLILLSYIRIINRTAQHYDKLTELTGIQTQSNIKQELFASKVMACQMMATVYR